MCSWQLASSSTKIVLGLNHPLIANAYDTMSFQGEEYIVLEYVEGINLKGRLSGRGQFLSQKEVVMYGIEMAKILEYLHRQPQPIVHRNIKPDSFIITAERGLKLVDFSIATKYSGNQWKDDAVGTVGYAAPEQYNGKAEPRSDLYGLGMTMFYLLVGREPMNLP